ncbi:MAG: hypothetical protein ACKVJK_18480 [Methylophagaceae bacterium]|jgi:hypothetical protein|tara:strand:+ start:251 stop:988 length:738 start_codon:yes stop_codon:yes gene_type:complete
MANPSTRAAFKEHCLRRLGKPVIEINVDDDQVDDRVDEALSYYWDFHFDGIEQTYYKWQITEQDKTNRYLTVPENIIGVVDLFDIGDATSTNNLFNIRYQIALNDLYDLSRYELVPYYMNFQNIRMIEEILVGKQSFRYNRHANQLHIDMDWNRIDSSNYIIAKCYRIIDPEVFGDVYKDWWLLRYASSLIKKQWGSNLTKFEGMQLPGGVTFNGAKLYDDATQEIEKLEEEIRGLAYPPEDMIG